MVYLKYLFIQIGGAAVIAIGAWTLMEKSGYISFIATSTMSVSSYILLFAGIVVMLTGFLGCGAMIQEHKKCLSVISEELKQNLNKTIVETYAEPGKKHITSAIDHLQQDFKCCGSGGHDDWRHSGYINSAQSADRLVPDSCCKTMTMHCGRRDHPSNIYKVEGGCITKLEEFIQEHLLLIGGVSIGIACFQVRDCATLSFLRL
ncbi:hypothetical protein GDO86_005138 [Hymenochirus boettgeri]|uniref:Tetraspanin n=1 Tax=Hymenochirus boettgeri TaxID=247094 RepID=A0A8T2J698_9PIPI|nr:hypothetical protein GDO86_005138 [Hymenochirus boettgeri]